MSVQSLRTALEELVEQKRAKVEGTHLVPVTILERMLAAHPAEPAPVVTDEAVERVMRDMAMWDEDCGLPFFPDETDGGRTAVRHILETAAPLLGFRPLLDREAATKHLYALLRDAEQRDRDALDKLGWVGSVMPGVPEDKLRPHCVALVDSVMELAWPMPTQEQIAEVITARALVEDESFGPAPGTVEHSRALADAVLALLNGAESYGKEQQ